MANSRLPSVPRLHSDESLNGFVARLAESYVFEMPQHLLSAIEIDTTGMSDLHRDKSLISTLEARLGLAIDSLAKRRYAPAGRKLSHIRFAGHEVRETAFAGRSPRIPPHTIRQLGYYRICWDLAFVPADPDTGERLISECPSCNTRLTWKRPDFVHCYACNEPLAKAQQKSVSNDVRLAAAIFSSLVSLNKETTADARSCLAPVLRPITPGLLFQCLYELSSRPISERRGRGAVPVSLDWENGLIRMLQLATGWSSAVLGLIDELTAGGRRRQDKSAAAFKFGRLRKILPSWGAIPQVHGIALPVARAIAAGKLAPYRPHDRFRRSQNLKSDSVAPSDAALSYDWFENMSARLQTAFPGLATDSLVKELEDLASPEMVKIRWGLSMEVISELTDAGYLRRVDTGYRGALESDSPLYRVSEIEQFFENLRDRYEAAPRNTRRIGFTMIVSKIRSTSDTPNVRLIQAVCDGSLRPIRIKDRARNGLECLQFGSDRATEWIKEQLKMQSAS